MLVTAADVGGDDFEYRAVWRLVAPGIDELWIVEGLNLNFFLAPCT
jgi:hypothetical protein